jgi:glycosyltransferase-like protein
MRKRSMPDESRSRQVPLKIGLLTHSVNPRGGVVHTVELAHALHDAGHQVTVMAPAAPGQRLFRPVRCATELVPIAGVPQDMVEMVAQRIEAYVSHLSALLQHTRFDVLHCHDGIGGNALATLRERGLIDGFVRTVHHLDDFSDAQLMRWQQRSVTEARQVFCLSRQWHEVLAKQHGIDASEVWNGIDVRRFTPAPEAGDAALAHRLGIRPDAPVLLAVGGVEERKNTLRLLQAFIQLRAARPGLQLVVAGGASLLDHAPYAREFAALVRAAELPSGPGQSLLVTGPLADADMPGLYRLADVVAMPSVREGFGLVVLEALASGVPVVVSRIAPFTEYLDEGDCSWADPFDPEAIGRAIAAALDGASPARIAGSSERLARRFSWVTSAERHVSLYRRH